MDLMDWEVPLNIQVYHFHGTENKRNPVMRERPRSDIDIEALFRADTGKQHITYLDALCSRIMKVRRLLSYQFRRIILMDMISLIINARPICLCDFYAVIMLTKNNLCSFYP